MTFEDDLAAARDAEIEFRDVQVALNGKPYTVRFLQVDGVSWAKEADRNPARPGVMLDARFGYDIRTLGLAIAKVSGRLVDADGGLRELKPESWDSLFKTVGGSTAQRLYDAIWDVNELAPARAVEQAKKGAAAGLGTPSA